MNRVLDNCQKVLANIILTDYLNNISDINIDVELYSETDENMIKICAYFGNWTKDDGWVCITRVNKLGIPSFYERVKVLSPVKGSEKKYRKVYNLHPTDVVWSSADEVETICRQLRIDILNFIESNK
jgi:hypothetical protein